MALETLAEPVSAAPEPRPPEHRPTPRQWLRANLFSSPFNSVLTVIFGAVIGWALYQMAYWVLVTANWRIIEVNLRGFMIGRFPVDELWRLWTSLYVLMLTAGLALGVLVRTATQRAEESGTGADVTSQAGSPPSRRLLDSPVVGVFHRFWPLILALAVILGFTRTILPTLLTGVAVAVFLLARAVGVHVPLRARWLWLITLVGLILALQIVSLGDSGVGWDDWGGIQLSIFATIAGIVLAFPLGLLLALGRRSSLPGIQAISIAFIELFRAVPLITLLFMGNFMIGFFLPTWMDPPSRLTRAIIAITLFQAAYIAEIVRGGLQSVERGQIEAAQAVGLSPTGVQRLVVLPQALRAVIPAMVGQFISLFKDTSLLAILAFPDLLRVAEIAPTTDEFRGLGLKPVTLVFAGFLYWAGSITMARESRRLERRLGVGQR
jgi:general L-amino acid transport system permease protein